MTKNRFLTGVAVSALLVTPAAFAQSSPAVQTAPAEPTAPSNDAPAAAATVTGSGQDNIQPEAAPDATTAADVVVTGSRLTTTGYTAPTPVTVVGSDFLATRAPTTVGDTLAEIPSFRPTGGLSQGTAGTFTTGQATLDLRGLGTTRTLVLVNGLRHVPNQATGALDTNVIPVGLIERIDVVTGGASAAYGSDAVAGVVNFVLNERLEGIKGTIQNGITEEGDSYEFTANLAGGATFADGRGRITYGGDYSYSAGSGTMYSRDWGRRETGIVRLAGNRAAGLPALLIADQNHLTIAPGGLITACTQRGVLVTGAACAVGNLTFDDAGNPRPFVFGNPVGPIQQVGGEGYNQFRNQLLRVGGRRLNGLAKVTYDITDDLTVFAEGSFGRFEVRSRTIDYLNTNIVINRDNPFIPASLATQMDANGITQLRMNKLNFAQKGGRAPSNVNDFWQAVGGVKGKIFGDWNWDASYLQGVGRTRYRIDGLILLPNYYASLYAVPGSGGAVCGPTATNPMLGVLSAAQRALLTSGCVPMSPFGTFSQSDAAFNYVSPRVEQLTAFDRRSAAVNLSGSPFSTWAGEVAFAVGAEWRRDKVDVTTDALTAARSRVSAFDAANPQPGSGKVTVKEGYVEVNVPLAKDTPFLQSLDLNAAGRVTDYSTSGTVETWKLGVTWEPVDFLRFRGTRSRDIRAPNVPELFYRGNDGLATGANPLTGRSNVINTASLNNPDLQPEKADTLTVGVVFQPQWDFARNFRASFDYFDIKLNDVIATVPVLEVLNRFYVGGQTELAQFITFDTSQPSGFSRVDVPLLNLNRQEERGFDVAVNYTSSLDSLGMPGRVSIGAQGTRLIRLETFDSAGVGLGNLAGAIPKWRVNTTLGYSLGGFDATLNARYNSRLTYNVTLVDPSSPGYVSTAPNSISDNYLPAATYFGLNLAYNVVDKDGRKITFFGLVDNLFDKDPPAAAFQLLGGIGNTPSSSFNPYDLLGRAYKAGIRFNF